MDGSQISPLTFDSEVNGDSAYLAVTTSSTPLSVEGTDQIADLKSVASPGEVLFSGLAQRNIDDNNGVQERLPWVFAMIAIATIVIIFMMTGSVLRR